MKNVLGVIIHIVVLFYVIMYYLCASFVSSLFFWSSGIQVIFDGFDVAC